MDSYFIFVLGKDVSISHHKRVHTPWVNRLLFTFQTCIWWDSANTDWNHCHNQSIHTQKPCFPRWDFGAVAAKLAYLLPQNEGTLIAKLISYISISSQIS